MIPDSICTLYWILNVERAENTGQDMNFWQRSRFSRHISRDLWIYFFTRGKCFFTWRIYFYSRPSVNYVKDWPDQLFLLPGLEKGFTYRCDQWEIANSSHYSVYSRPFAAWWHPTNQLDSQPVDSRASLLLTSEKAVFATRRNSCYKIEIVLYMEGIFLYRRDRFLQEGNIRLQHKIVFLYKKKTLFLEQDLLIEYHFCVMPTFANHLVKPLIFMIFLIFGIKSKPFKMLLIF